MNLGIVSFRRADWWGQPICSDAGRRGFTLIELLIVICVLFMLTAMIMPVYATVRRSTLRSTTEFVQKRVDAGLRLYKIEWGNYPCQARYPDPITASFPNRLGYQVGQEIDWANGTAQKVLADILTAESKYDETSPSALTFSGTDNMPNSNGMYYRRVNRAARTQVRLGVLSGNLDMRGVVITKTDGTVFADRRNTSVLVDNLAERSSRDNPGWASDFLEGELDQRFYNSIPITSGAVTLVPARMAIQDAWGRPLIYIYQGVPQVTMGAPHAQGYDKFLPSVRYGLGFTGFDLDPAAPAKSPANELVSAGRPILLYLGRIRLSLSDAGDGKPTPANATWFPSASDLMHADMRFYAPPGYETEFELWSAGPDGKFSYMRDDPVNRDNIAVVRYDRSLDP